MSYSYRDPSPALREFVRVYMHREASIPTAPIVQPLRARFDPFVAFQLRDPYVAFERDVGRPRVLPPAFVVGPQTRRVADLLLRGHVSVFSVSFRPAGLARLFGVRACQLTDSAHAADDVFGPIIHRLHERILDARDVSEMADAADRVLLELVPGAGAVHVVDGAASLVLERGGRVDVGDVVRDTGLSARQFERRFVERVGVAPKLYARIARVDRALRLKAQAPGRSWTEIGAEAGYFDQSHLLKDFKALVGATPSASVFYYQPLEPNT